MTANSFSACAWLLGGSLVWQSKSEVMVMVGSGRLCMLCTQMPVSCRRAVLLNLKYDEEVTSFVNAAGAGAANELTAFSSLPKTDAAVQQPCTAISFKTGGLLAPVRGACKGLYVWLPLRPALLIH